MGRKSVQLGLVVTLCLTVPLGSSQSLSAQAHLLCADCIWQGVPGLWECVWVTYSTGYHQCNQGESYCEMWGSDDCGSGGGGEHEAPEVAALSLDGTLFLGQSLRFDERPGSDGVKEGREGRLLHTCSGAVLARRFDEGSIQTLKKRTVKIEL